MAALARLRHAGCDHRRRLDDRRRFAGHGRHSGISLALGTPAKVIRSARLSPSRRPTSRRRSSPTLCRSSIACVTAASQSPRRRGSGYDSRGRNRYRLLLAPHVDGPRSRRTVPGEVRDGGAIPHLAPAASTGSIWRADEKRGGDPLTEELAQFLRTVRDSPAARIRPTQRRSSRSSARWTAICSPSSPVANDRNPRIRQVSMRLSSGRNPS